MTRAGPDSQVEAALGALGAAWPRTEVAVVLGSGLGGCPPELTDCCQLPYDAVPGLGACTVPGHDGQLMAGNLAGLSLLIFRGRHHLYEGRTPGQVALPVRLAAQLGARLLLLFSAVGAVDSELEPGTWVFIEDHINLTGRNPLEGVGDQCGSAFVDLTHTYRADLYPDLAERAAPRLERGVLAMFPGPSYETPAEVRMAAVLGARVVGMSTVPEAVWARYLGLDVIALSRVVNPAAGVVDRPLRHADVVAQGAIGAAQVPGLITAAVEAWRDHSWVKPG